MLLSAQIYLMNKVNSLFAADGIADLGTQLFNIIIDLLTPATSIGSAIAAAMCLFYVIKALAGDEQDVKSSIRRAKVTLVILIVLVLFKTIMNWILAAIGASTIPDQKVV